MDPITRAVLVKWADGKAPEKSVRAVGPSVADAELAALGRACEIPVRVTGQVLRRSFGWLDYGAGVSPPTIRQGYGHISLDPTLHYTGVEQTGSGLGLLSFAKWDGSLVRQLYL